MKYIRYFWYVLRHKWFVLMECYKLDIIWLGIVHDWTKFVLDEFIPYANYFYGNIKNDTRDETGYYKPTDTGDKEFDFAWLLHQKRNKHHWQWWILPEDEGGIKVLDVPDKYRKEMLADWRGAGKAQGTPDTVVWYKKNKNKLVLSDETRCWIEAQLQIRMDI